MRSRLGIACVVSGALLAACSSSDEPSAASDQHLEGAWTEQKSTQAAWLGEMLTQVRTRTAWHGPIDWTKLLVDGQSAIRDGDGSDNAFYGALFHAFIAVPQGHQWIGLDQGCGETIPEAAYSTHGVCGRPHGRGVIITKALESNPLGLAAGDVVVGIGSQSGKGILDELMDRPMCTGSRPSLAYARTSSAATIGDLVREGETLTVEGPNRVVRTVVVSHAAATTGSQPIGCSDPFGRSIRYGLGSTIRPDGIAVIRVPSWTDLENPRPPNATEEETLAYIERFTAKLQAVFDAVKSAPGIVWDMRGNGGGMTVVAMEVASGFPGATGGEVTHCTPRIVDSDPPQFYDFRYADYGLTPGGRFAYQGKVAVITDGMNYSAADYFPLVVKAKTKALLVGAPTAGAFGASSESRNMPAQPSFTVYTDSNRCASSIDDSPLEGRSVEPHVPIGYTPQDLAKGVDSVLERAVAEVAKQIKKK